jgi:hypothetical protein
MPNAADHTRSANGRQEQNKNDTGLDSKSEARDGAIAPLTFPLYA